MITRKYDKKQAEKLKHFLPFDISEYDFTPEPLKSLDPAPVFRLRTLKGPELAEIAFLSETDQAKAIKEALRAIVEVRNWGVSDNVVDHMPLPLQLILFNKIMASSSITAEESEGVKS